MLSSGCGITLSFFCLQQQLYSYPGPQVTPEYQHFKVLLTGKEAKSPRHDKAGSEVLVIKISPGGKQGWKSDEGNGNQ
jgi:hypothetical protein